MIMTLALMASVSVAAPGFADRAADREALATAARQMDVAAIRLRHALKAPVTRRRENEPRYCFDTARLNLSSPHLVCRTLRDWQALDVEPVVD